MQAQTLRTASDLLVRKHRRRIMIADCATRDMQCSNAQCSAQSAREKVHTWNATVGRRQIKAKWRPRSPKGTEVRVREISAGKGRREEPLIPKAKQDAPVQILKVKSQIELQK